MRGEQTETNERDAVTICGVLCCVDRKMWHKLAQKLIFATVWFFITGPRNALRIKWNRRYIRRECAIYSIPVSIYLFASAFSSTHPNTSICVTLWFSFVFVYVWYLSRMRFDVIYKNTQTEWTTAASFLFRVIFFSVKFILDCPKHQSAHLHLAMSSFAGATLTKQNDKFCRISLFSFLFVSFPHLLLLASSLLSHFS